MSNMDLQSNATLEVMGQEVRDAIKDSLVYKQEQDLFGHLVDMSVMKAYIENYAEKYEEEIYTTVTEKLKSYKMDKQWLTLDLLYVFSLLYKNYKLKSVEPFVSYRPLLKAILNKGTFSLVFTIMLEWWYGDEKYPMFKDLLDSLELDNELDKKFTLKTFLSTRDNIIVTDNLEEAITDTISKLKAIDYIDDDYSIALDKIELRAITSDSSLMELFGVNHDIQN